MTGADVMPGPLARKFGPMRRPTLPVIGPVGAAAFFEGYGMVETGGGWWQAVSRRCCRSGSVTSLGFTLPGWKVRVADLDDQPVAGEAVGELQIKGPGVLKGYRRRGCLRRCTHRRRLVARGDPVRGGPFGLLSFRAFRERDLKAGGYSVYRSRSRPT